MKAAILQFSKTPVVGEVKTRMIGALSAEKACDLHRAMTRCVAEEICAVSNVDREIWSTSGGSFMETLCQTFAMEHRIQCLGDLGERLSHATSSTLMDRSAAVIVGSDCPFLTRHHYDDALTLLCTCEKDLVLAPAIDGGYVLIGMKAFNAQLFRGIHWGSADVLEQTLAKAAGNDLQVGLMETLRDIDRPEDLTFLPDKLCQYRALA